MSWIILKRNKTIAEIWKKLLMEAERLGFTVVCHLNAQMTVHISHFNLAFSERDLPNSI